MTLLAGISCHRNEGTGVSVAEGKQIYNQHCASCHGLSGNGKGALAGSVSPKPRDLTQGIFKFRTVHGPIPSDNDIMRVMKMGVPGTSMPGWDLLSQNQWKSVLEYVKSLSPRLTSQKLGTRFEVPAESKSTPEELALGKHLYEVSGCVGCHGAQGHGDGPAATHLKDVWGDSIVPRDLTEGPLKWGNGSPEIYRTLSMGIPGTPMPAFGHTFSHKELWALVHYLKSIQQPTPAGYDPSDPKRNLIQVSKVEGGFDDAQWAKVKAVPVFLKPLWYQRGAVEWLTVKALHNTKEIVFDLQWKGGQQNAAGLWFPAHAPKTAAGLPFLLMGEGSQGVIAQASANQGIWHAVVRRPMTSGEKEGYVSFGIWNGELAEHKGPELFSEWMIYELK